MCRALVVLGTFRFKFVGQQQLCLSEATITGITSLEVFDPDPATASCAHLMKSKLILKDVLADRIASNSDQTQGPSCSALQQTDDSDQRS
jgi:hypothetical protein